MDSQHVKESERLLKSARQYFCHIFWSLRNEISSENSVLVVSDILRLFVNILTPDFSLIKSECLTPPIQIAIISKSKKIFPIFLSISEIYIKFGILWKRRSAWEVISFWYFRLQKAELLQSLKSSLSEHLWTVNMLKGPKDYFNLHGSIFVRFFDNSERKSARKFLFW